MELTEPSVCEIIFCNHGLFSQSLLWKTTVSQECTPLLARGSFQKRPLIVTVKRRLMRHQEIKLKYLQSVNPKTAVSVKSQNLLVIQVNYNMICFPCYCLLVHL